MERKGLLCCFLLVLSLTPVLLIPVDSGSDRGSNSGSDSDSGWQVVTNFRPQAAPRPVQPLRTLTNINELNHVSFGSRPPQHGLNLLHWLARSLTFNANNDDMTPNFDPRSGRFGSHQYHNPQELLLVAADTSYQFYTLGNINTNDYRLAAEFPPYVKNKYNPPARNVPGDFYALRNLDRVIVRVKKAGRSPVIDMVFITQHPNPATRDYDQSSTFRVSKGLLQTVSRYTHASTFTTAMGYGL